MKATANNNNENQVIYNKIAKVARRAFEFIEIEPGQYSANQILAALKKCKAHWNDRAPEFYTLEDAETVAVGSFSCQFLIKDAFRILAKVATAWNIPTAGRATFEREKEDTATVAAFDVPAAAAAICKAIDKKDSRENMRYIYMDVKRRAAVASDGRVLTVAAVPSLNTTDTERAGFMIHPSLFKAGRVAIDANNKASNGHKVAESPVLRYPNWAGVFPTVYDTDAITFDKKAAAALKKAVAAATTQAEQIYSNGEVIQTVAIYGEANTNKITVRSRQKENILINNERIEKTTYSDHDVTTADTLQRSFCWVLNGIRFASLPTFEKIYLPGNGRAAVVVGKNAVSLLMPVEMCEDWQNPTNANYNNYTRPNYAQPVNVIDNLLNVPAAPVAIDDTTESDTAAAVAIDTNESTTDTDTTTAAAAVMTEEEKQEARRARRRERDRARRAAQKAARAAANESDTNESEATPAPTAIDTNESDTAAPAAILNDGNEGTTDTDTNESEATPAPAAVVSFWQYAARAAAAVVLLIVIVAGRTFDTANNSDTAAAIGKFKAITATKAAKATDTNATTIKATQNTQKAAQEATKAAKVADTNATTIKAAQNAQKAAQNESDTAAPAAILNDGSEDTTDTAAPAAIDTNESDTAAPAAILNDGSEDTTDTTDATGTDTAESDTDTAESNDAPTTAPTGPALGLSAAACVFFPII